MRQGAGVREVPAPADEAIEMDVRATAFRYAFIVALGGFSSGLDAALVGRDMGADGYGKDALARVPLAKSLLEERAVQGA